MLTYFVFVFPSIWLVSQTKHTHTEYICLLSSFDGKQQAINI